MGQAHAPSAHTGSPFSSLPARFVYSPSNLQRTSARCTVGAQHPAGSFFGGFRTPAADGYRTAFTGRHPKPCTHPVLFAAGGRTERVVGRCRRGCSRAVSGPDQYRGGRQPVPQERFATTKPASRWQQPSPAPPSCLISAARSRGYCASKGSRGRRHCGLARALPTGPTTKKKRTFDVPSKCGHLHALRTLGIGIWDFSLSKRCFARDGLFRYVINSRIGTDMELRLYCEV
jgi:hypothetical protein